MRPYGFGGETLWSLIGGIWGIMKGSWEVFRVYRVSGLGFRVELTVEARKLEHDSPHALKVKV